MGPEARRWRRFFTPDRGHIPPGSDRTGRHRIRAPDVRHRSGAGTEEKERGRRHELQPGDRTGGPGYHDAVTLGDESRGACRRAGRGMSLSIAIANLSTSIDDATFAAAVAAIDVQVSRDFQPEWGAGGTLTADAGRPQRRLCQPRCGERCGDLCRRRVERSHTRHERRVRLPCATGRPALRVRLSRRLRAVRRAMVVHALTRGAGDAGRSNDGNDGDRPRPARPRRPRPDGRIRTRGLRPYSGRHLSGRRDRRGQLRHQGLVRIARRIVGDEFPRSAAQSVRRAPQGLFPVRGRRRPTSATARPWTRDTWPPAPCSTAIGARPAAAPVSLTGFERSGRLSPRAHPTASWFSRSELYLVAFQLKGGG